MFVGQKVVLDGSSSSDPDGDELSYRWRVDSRPAGSSAQALPARAAQASVLVDKPGRYIVSLVVNDGEEAGFDTMIIDVRNTVPVADAGPDQTASVGALVLLDGTASTDRDGSQLSFSWSFVSIPAGSAARLQRGRTATPQFVMDLPGRYVIALIVNDGSANSAPDIVIVTSGNSAPAANAGPDQTAVQGQVVTLDGSGSSDADGNALTYQWTFVEKPAGSAAVLSSPTALKPTFTVDVKGTYRLQLVVNDGEASSAPDLVDVVVGNTAPVAAAGLDQNVSLGSLVTLDGSGSSDVDGDPLTFMWSLTSVPAGSAATLSSPSAVKPTFTVDRPGTYTAQLMVNDGTVLSAGDTVNVTTSNVAPVANAGPPQTVTVGQLVVLNGGGSSDADGDALTFAWSIITRPAGSTAQLSNPTAVGPSFTPDRDGDFVVQLIVNDGQQSSAPSTVTISTLNSTPVANAGTDQAGITVGTQVLLSGALSSDADGHPLTYFWALITQPDGSTAVLSSASAVNPSFTPDVPGEYIAQLVVSDGLVNSAPDTVLIEAVPVVLPVVAIETTDGSAAEAAAETGTLTVTRTGPTTSPLTVFVSVGGTATNGGDYSEIFGSVTIPIGASSAPVVVTPTEDQVDEGEETVVVSLIADPAYTLGSPVAGTVTIADNDGQVVTVQATVPDASEAGPAAGAFTFTRTGNTSASLSVNVQRGGTAAADDYSEGAGGSPFVVTIPAGQASVNVPVTPKADIVIESPETVIYTVVAGTGYSVGAPAEATVTIADDPPVVNLVATDADASEAGSGTGTFTFQRSGGALTLPLTVNYTIGGSALNGTDYTLIASSVVMAAGEASTTVTITPTPDGSVEGDEGVTLTLAGSADYVAGSLNSATVTIHDTPLTTQVTVAATDPTASETGGDTGTFRFTRTGSTAAPLTVTYSVGGSAANGGDYATIGGTILIPTSASFADLTITAIPDGLVEGSETVVVTVTDGVDYDLGSPATATVTIGDLTDPCAGGGGVLVNGATHCGTIAIAHEVDVWTFTATVGERIAIHAGEIVDQNDLRPRIRLLSPTAAVLADTSGVAVAVINGVIAPATGTYQVESPASTASRTGPDPIG